MTIRGRGVPRLSAAPPVRAVVRAAVGALVAGAALGACSAGPSVDSSPTAPLTSAVAAPGAAASVSPLPEGAAVPEFTGKWAVAFERAYRGSTSDLQRQVLADGEITEQEMAALQDDMRTCLGAAGFTDVEFSPDGGSSGMTPPGMSDADFQRVTTSCAESSFGSVDILYNNLRRNPSNQDEFTIMAACLVRQGLVAQDYSAEDYGRDAPADTFPFDADDARFGACVSDPLGAGTS